MSNKQKKKQLSYNESKTVNAILWKLCLGRQVHAPKLLKRIYDRIFYLKMRNIGANKWDRVVKVSWSLSLYFVSKINFSLQDSIEELAEHLVRVLWLRPRHHVTGIPHHKHAQVLHGLDISRNLTIDAEAGAVGAVVLVDGRPVYEVITISKW